MSQKPNKPNRSSKSNQPQFTLFHLESQHVGLTLSAALKALLPESTWGQVRQWITGRHVQINGNMCLDESRRLTAKDVIKMWREALPKPVKADQLKLVFVDEHLVVVEKPAGVTSVRHREERRAPNSRKQSQATLEDLLPAAIAKYLGKPLPEAKRPLPRNRGPQHVRQFRKAGPPPLPTVFPVHRLDRDTSGLMIFARTRMAEQKLMRLFKDHRIERQYWAVVLGHVDSQTIRSTLVRDRGDGVRGSAPDGTEPDGGQIAITHVHLVEQLPGYSVIRCKLETGRTHQIRIHLSELGHALCGDKVYVRSRDGQSIVDRSSAPRHALHSERLMFKHPLTGEQLEFQMRLPEDLARWFKRLRVRTEEAEKAAKDGKAKSE